MRVDPNEPVTPPDRLSDHKGIPLRLEIAAPLLVPMVDHLTIWAIDEHKQKVANAVEYALDWADALIAAHNATCDTAGDALSRMARAVKLLADIAEHIADRVDVVDGSDGEQHPNEWMSMQTEFGDRLYEFTKAASDV